MGASEHGPHPTGKMDGVLNLTDVFAMPLWTRDGRKTRSLLATIQDPTVIRRILTHLGLSLDVGDPSSGRAPPWAAGPSA
jgi:hypothetical protein